MYYTCDDKYPYPEQRIFLTGGANNRYRMGINEKRPL